LHFFSSKRDARVPVPNQYFGAFMDGSIKYRDIELRRRDTTLWVQKIQLAVLEILAKADTPKEWQSTFGMYLHLWNMQNTT